MADKNVIRRVLRALCNGEPTYRDFRNWNGFVDWDATAKLMDEPPINTALCHILDKRGKIVKSECKPVLVGRDVVANTEAEAEEILAKESLKFIRWWEPDTCSDAGDNQREVCGNNENVKDSLKDYRSRTFAATRDFFVRRKHTKRKTKEKLLF